MTVRTYASPEAFKQALERRLRTSAKTGAELARRRQLLVFDRFLARIVAVLGDTATLKGGLVLELRLKRARTTKDVDLGMTGSPDDIFAKLQEAARHDLGDLVTFEVTADRDHPEIQNEGMPYKVLRFRAECRLAGKLYGQSFGVDVAFGDPILGEPEIVTAEDVLAFAGIAPPKLRLYPIETHIAEKLHAYTMPRARPNSRVKDLPDIALLATTQTIAAKRLRDALEQTFTFRKTTHFPRCFPIRRPPGWHPMPRWHARISSPGPRSTRSRRRPGPSSIRCSRGIATPYGVLRPAHGPGHERMAFGRTPDGAVGRNWRRAPPKGVVQ